MPQQTTKAWFHGLLAAIIGGAANSVSNIIIAPDTFNIHEGLGRLLGAAGIAALLSAAMFLKQSPLPDTVVVETVTETHQVKKEITKEAVDESTAKEGE